MKLISKTHDYYDGVIRTTKQDESLLFVREPRTIKVNKKVFRVDDYKDRNYEYFFKFGAIGFCGALYPFIQVEEKSLGSTTSSDDGSCYYDINSFFSVYKGIAKEKSDGWWGISGLKRQAEHWLTSGMDVGGFRSVQYNIHQDKSITELFHKEHVAYFAIIPEAKYHKQYNIEIYPVLKNYMFYKVYDSFTTYQMVEMFLTNQLVQHDNRKVIIPDVLKAQSKGFDKWSFRKMPEG